MTPLRIATAVLAATAIAAGAVLLWTGEPPARAGTDVPPSSLYEFTLERIDGTEQSLSDYAGKVLLIVNVASKCGYTPQYEGLEALYEKYGERDFAVLGFPSNDFQQEPGSNREIARFCRSTYGVEFPMFAKTRVKGDGKHPLYSLLTSQPPPLGGEVKWNFEKFLVDREGRVVKRFRSAKRPEGAEITAAIEELLAGKPA